MSKKLLYFIGSVFIILFFALYFSQYTGYYDYSGSRRVNLTNDAINRFEDDLKSGKKIDYNSYLVQEKNYNNAFSRVGMKISVIIEKLFNKGMDKIFEELEDAIDD